MAPETTPYPDDGMLFVRVDGTLQIMLKAPLVVIGLIALASAMPAQNSSGIPKSMDLAIYPDGLTHVITEFKVDPLQPDFEVSLPGSTIDNFVAVGQNEFLLASQIDGSVATIETLGAELVSLQYDVHDLVSKQGRVWSFELDSSSGYSLLMPENSVIIGMSSLPAAMEVLEDRSKLTLKEGSIRIDYIFGSQQDPAPSQPEDGSPIIVGAVIAAAAMAGIMYLRKIRRAKPMLVSPQSPKPVIPNLQAVLDSTPDLREDDRDIVSFIHENGGSAKESELRKKFLLPRTTMWRAVKRLERHGIVEIRKTDLQNLIILKEPEDGQ